MIDFINDAELASLLESRPNESADLGMVRDIIAKSLAKEPLTVSETATLLRCESTAVWDEIFAAAREIKRRVYGNRIVIFAPLYLGNRCVNDCLYCGFRCSNIKAVRKTLTDNELASEVSALEQHGHKRLILVFGEHSQYDARFIASTVEKVYAVKNGPGEIRRVNINAAPLDKEGFKVVKQSGIGTYQIFQESYHHATYAKCHPAGTRKADYLWRLNALSRAMEAGCDDVGIGALFGLYDWRFEVLGLVSHARFLADKYGCGPHTISFPRLRPVATASEAKEGEGALEPWPVSDLSLRKIVATLRLAVPYTGLILTAREPAQLRNELLSYGVSQIDAGSKIELGQYAAAREAGSAQFELADVRSLDEIMRELIAADHLPSFCTACYRKGRTGEQFMEFAIPGFIANLCTPNALLTLQEYLLDYSGGATAEAGENLIERELQQLTSEERRREVRQRLHLMRTKGTRDLYF